MNQKIAIIIGAGPAGLTAAYELLDKTDIKPLIFEESNFIGGISRTVNYKGNRIDIGGHRFFSKSDRIMLWWQNILPLQGAPSKDDIILGRKVPLSSESTIRRLGSKEYECLKAPDPQETDQVMLNRKRLSRIFFLRKFFDYPISLNWNTISNLGLYRTMRIFLSYIKSSLYPITEEKSLEDFLINRFGRELYLTFFKDYTEKVWGVSCKEITADWGAQRIKGLTIRKALSHAIKGKIIQNQSLQQKDIETSLIGQFMYPKLGPGQMWEEVARIIQENGGEIRLGNRVKGIVNGRKRINQVIVEDLTSGKEEKVNGDYFLSSMPIRDLIASFQNSVPAEVKKISDGLMYRDFITVGVLLKKLNIENKDPSSPTNLIPDNWIYIQERDVKLGRLQIFNNWSPYLVAEEDNIWIGLEYFCNEGDHLWQMSEKKFTKFALGELEKIGIIQKENVLDSVVIKVKKTYPAYFGTYPQFDRLKAYLDGFENLFLMGRNGMHRYNNMDHSMLTAMKAVENIRLGSNSKENIWQINAETEYHEER